jgi:two-component system OmpR family sensor kinase
LPIRWRLTIFNALIIGVILLALGLSLFVLLRGALHSGLEETVRSRAVATARALESGDGLDDVLGDDEVLRQLRAEGVFLLVRDKRGKIIEQTPNFSRAERTTTISTTPTNDPIWERARETRDPAGGTAELSSEGPDYVYAVPVDLPSRPTWVVEAGKSYDSVEDALDAFITVLIVGGLLAFVLSVGGAYLLARAALSPVEAVVSSARQMTEGDLSSSRRLPIVSDPKDEIGRLTTTINGLLGRLEAALARREEALWRQRRFAADASHELRTPLTSIAGYARMLDEWAINNPRTAREGVVAIRRESERMSRLVEGLLALTRGDEGALVLDIEEHDLAAVAQEATRMAQGGAVEKKLSLEYLPTNNKEETLKVPFDRDLICQAASNLLDNAIKYTPEGGKVRVRVTKEEEGNDNGAEWAALEVSDTGVGIAEDQLPHIFERFYRADPSRGGAAGGAGLGLSIACQIAQAHGGKIEVESTPGVGSTFRLLLPKRLSGA